MRNSRIVYSKLEEFKINKQNRFLKMEVTKMINHIWYAQVVKPTMAAVMNPKVLVTISFSSSSSIFPQEIYPT